MRVPAHPCLPPGLPVQSDLGLMAQLQGSPPCGLAGCSELRRLWSPRASEAQGLELPGARSNLSLDPSWPRRLSCHPAHCSRWL